MVFISLDAAAGGPGNGEIIVDLRGCGRDGGDGGQFGDI